MNAKQQEIVDQLRADILAAYEMYGAEKGEYEYKRFDVDDEQGIDGGDQSVAIDIDEGRGGISGCERAGAMAVEVTDHGQHVVG